MTTSSNLDGSECSLFPQSRGTREAGSPFLNPVDWSSNGTVCTSVPYEIHTPPDSVAGDWAEEYAFFPMTENPHWKPERPRLSSVHDASGLTNLSPPHILPTNTDRTLPLCFPVQSHTATHHRNIRFTDPERACISSWTAQLGQVSASTLMPNPVATHTAPPMPSCQSTASYRMPPAPNQEPVDEPPSGYKSLLDRLLDSTKKSTRGQLPWMGSCVLEGPSFPVFGSSADFFIPQIKKYHEDASNSTSIRTQSGPQVEHLDICTVWKGLSQEHADELLLWEEIFRSCIERKILPLLDYLGDEHSRSHEFARTKFHSLELDLTSLVVEMVGIFQRRDPQLHWFESRQNIYRQVAQFVRLHDCLTGPTRLDGNPESAGTVSVLVRPSMTLSSSASNLKTRVAEVKWQPAYISFEGLDMTPGSGQKLCFVPRLCRASATYESPESESDQKTIDWSTSCDWLHFDPFSSTFVGLVPLTARTEFESESELSSNGTNRRVHITFKATVKESFDMPVRFEYVVRTRLTLFVQLIDQVNCSNKLESFCSGSQKSFEIPGSKFEILPNQVPMVYRLYHPSDEPLSYVPVEETDQRRHDNQEYLQDDKVKADHMVEREQSDSYSITVEQECTDNNTTPRNDEERQTDLDPISSQSLDTRVKNFVEMVDRVSPRKIEYTRAKVVRFECNDIPEPQEAEGYEESSESGAEEALLFLDGLSHASYLDSSESSSTKVSDVTLPAVGDTSQSSVEPSRRIKGCSEEPRGSEIETGSDNDIANESSAGFSEQPCLTVLPNGMTSGKPIDTQGTSFKVGQVIQDTPMGNLGNALFATVRKGFREASKKRQQSSLWQSSPEDVKELSLRSSAVSSDGENRRTSGTCSEFNTIQPRFAIARNKTAELAAAIRNALEVVPFDGKEDPRDVREIRKSILQHDLLAILGKEETGSERTEDTDRRGRR